MAARFPRAPTCTQIIVHTAERHQRKVGRSRVNLLCSFTGWVDVAACLSVHILMCVCLSCYMCIMLLCTPVCTLGCDVPLLHSQMECLQSSAHFLPLACSCFLYFFHQTNGVWHVPLCQSFLRQLFPSVLQKAKKEEIPSGFLSKPNQAGLGCSSTKVNKFLQMTSNQNNKNWRLCCALEC